MFFASLLGLVLVPVLMTWLIRGKVMSEKKNPISALLIALYNPLVSLVLRFRWLTLGVAIGALLFTWIPISRLGKEFMPPLNEGTILYMPGRSPRDLEPRSNQHSPTSTSSAQ